MLHLVFEIDRKDFLGEISHVFKRPEWLKQLGAEFYHNSIPGVRVTWKIRTKRKCGPQGIHIMF